jgi:hypothetical protein
MIPLRDENPTRITPYVTWALLAANIVIFLLQIGGGTQETRQGLTGSLAGWTMVPREVTQNVDLAINGPSLQPFWLTIFTSMFMHGGLMHLGGNMLFLLVFGNNIEDALGHARFLVFYLVCGVLAALAQIFWNPLSSIPTLGASGAIAGCPGRLPAPVPARPGQHAGVPGIHPHHDPSARVDIADLLDRVAVSFRRSPARWRRGRARKPAESPIWRTSAGSWRASCSCACSARSRRVRAVRAATPPRIALRRAGAAPARSGNTLASVRFPNARHRRLLSLRGCPLPRSRRRRAPSGSTRRWKR